MYFDLWLSLPREEVVTRDHIPDQTSPERSHNVLIEFNIYADKWIADGRLQSKLIKITTDAAEVNQELDNHTIVRVI